MNKSTEVLEQKIGYIFKDKNLLKLALTHKSYSNEKSRQNKSNERLEFLGDSVLSLVSSNYLYKKFPAMSEGELTKMRSHLVCEPALCGYATELGVGDWLIMGRGEEMTAGRHRPSILADAFEAIIAAIFLDSGMTAAKKFVLSFIKKSVAKTDFLEHGSDCKTKLQEIVQRQKNNIIKYSVVDTTGPEHDKVFNVQVEVNGGIIGRGSGKSKKEAEQLAAKEALLKLTK
jgi:ribonuclease-3